MTRESLRDELKASLADAAKQFTAPADEDFDRHLNVAAREMGWVRPRIVAGTLVLVAERDEYFAPADLVAWKGDRWGSGRRPQPWDANYPGRHPRVRLLESAGVRSLVFDPPPTAMHISLYGSTYTYEYLAAHVIADTAAATTLQPQERGLLLLRAQAEAVRELAIRAAIKTVSLRDGLTGQSRNSTPAALAEMLLRDWREAARAW